jgi:hypothetical protein
MSDEFYYIDENGNKSDAALHDAILDDVDDLPMRYETARGMVRDGYDVTTVRRMYVIPDKLPL